MKTTVKFFFAAGVAGFAGAALLYRLNAAVGEFSRQAELYGASAGEETRDLLALRREVSRMSLEEKIGQMLMVSVPGPDLDDNTAARLSNGHIGGIILLGKNVRSREQVRFLIGELQERGRGAGDPPLLIAVDQEGGVVNRFSFLRELTPQREIRSPEQGFEVARARARELAALGVNMNFSPVLDAATTSDFVFARAFRGDASDIASWGSAMVKGYREGGVIPVVKHFPGHGGTSVDSHRSLPAVSDTREKLKERMTPFRRAIEEGASVVMAGHLKFPAIDPDAPASLSPVFLERLLREELKFGGVMITDDLGMGAITSRYELPDAAVRAVRAGADIVLVVKNAVDDERIYRAIVAAAQNGLISEARIDQSVLRILRLKKSYLNFEG